MCFAPFPFTPPKGSTVLVPALLNLRLPAIRRSCYRRNPGRGKFEVVFSNPYAKSRATSRSLTVPISLYLLERYVDGSSMAGRRSIGGAIRLANFCQSEGRKFWVGAGQAAPLPAELEHEQKEKTRPPVPTSKNPKARPTSPRSDESYLGFPPKLASHLSPRPRVDGNGWLRPRVRATITS